MNACIKRNCGSAAGTHATPPAAAIRPALPGGSRPTLTLNPRFYLRCLVFSVSKAGESQTTAAETGWPQLTLPEATFDWSIFGGVFNIPDSATEFARKWPGRSPKYDGNPLSGFLG